MKIIKSNTVAAKVATKLKTAADRTAATSKVLKEAKQIGKKVNEIAQEAKEAAKDLGQLVLLKPFAPIMKAALIAKKIDPPSDLERLARTFYNEVVKRSDFDAANEFNDGTNIAISTETRRDFDPVTISALVSGIITWIQESRKKKEEGKPLTKAQEAAVKTSNIINEETKKAVDDEIKYQAGDAIMKVVEWLEENWMIVAAIIVIGYFGLKKSR